MQWTGKFEDQYIYHFLLLDSYKSAYNGGCNRGNLMISIYGKNHSNKLIIMPVGEDSPHSKCLKGFSLGTFEKKKRGLFLFWGISKIHTENALGGNLNRRGCLSIPPFLSFSVLSWHSRNK